MRRLFWTAFGAAVGVLAVRRVGRAAEALTPPALAASLSEAVAELGEAVRDFAADVREGMAERESELRSELGLDEDRAAWDDQALAVPARRRHALRARPADRLPLPTPRTGRDA